MGVLKRAFRRCGTDVPFEEHDLLTEMSRSTQPRPPRSRSEQEPDVAAVTPELATEQIDPQSVLHGPPRKAAGLGPSGGELPGAPLFPF